MNTLAVAITLLTGTLQAKEYPPPGPTRHPENLGVGIQRTMTLLATSTPTHRNHVKILFYGQSITEQKWSKMVADDLRKRFPNADLTIENRAIGGFASQLLIKPAEHDVYPFYPDLVIFHVYGANQQYETIIRSIRTRTAAEVLMQRDHVTKWPAEHPDPNVDKGLWWDNLMNNRFLPEIAKKYGCGLADIRGDWMDYLKANHLEPAQLLVDGVHLNDRGNFLMAQLVSRNLVYRPDLSRDSWKDLSRDYAVGRDVKWKDGRLTLPFDGNRVDLVAGGSGGSVEICIDGKKPSELPGTVAFSRPEPRPWGPLAFVRVDHDTPLVPESWTLKITGVSPDSKRWTYDVSGSVTGPDGSGSSDAPFRAISGRVKIDPDSFHRGFGKDPVPLGFTITWNAVAHYADSWSAPILVDKAREAVTTVAQGFPIGTHTLEIAGKAPIKLIRVYRPPYRN